MSDSVRPHRQQPTRLLCPWDSPGKNTGVDCHFLLMERSYLLVNINHFPINKKAQQKVAISWGWGQQSCTQQQVGGNRREEMRRQGRQFPSHFIQNFVFPESINTIQNNNKKRTGNIYLQSYKNVYSNFFHYRPKLEITQIPVTRLDNRAALFSCNRILLSNKNG